MIHPPYYSFPSLCTLPPPLLPKTAMMMSAAAARVARPLSLFSVAVAVLAFASSLAGDNGDCAGGAAPCSNLWTHGHVRPFLVSVYAVLISRLPDPDLVIPAEAQVTCGEVLEYALTLMSDDPVCTMMPDAEDNCCPPTTTGGDASNEGNDDGLLDEWRT
jgi:hypothetical protein